MNKDNSIADIFVTEVRDSLETVENDLMMIEKKQGDPAVIDHAFRALHNIKGAAAFMGFTNLSKLSHVAEDVLSSMRSGKVNVESKHIDALLLAIDSIWTMLEDVDNSNGMDISVITAQLANLVNGDKKKQSSEKAVNKITTNELLANLQYLDFTRFRLMEFRDSDHNLYLLRHDTSSGANRRVDTSDSLMSRIEKLGTIIKKKDYLPLELLEGKSGNKFTKYNVLFSSPFDNETIENKLNISGNALIPIPNKKAGGE